MNQSMTESTENNFSSLSAPIPLQPRNAALTGRRSPLLPQPQPQEFVEPQQLYPAPDGLLLQPLAARRSRSRRPARKERGEKKTSRQTPWPRPQVVPTFRHQPALQPRPPRRAYVRQRATAIIDSVGDAVGGRKVFLCSISGTKMVA